MKAKLVAVVSFALLVPLLSSCLGVPIATPSATPRQESNELKDRLASEMYPSKKWSDLDPLEQFHVRRTHPEIAAAEKAAKEPPIPTPAAKVKAEGLLTRLSSPPVAADKVSKTATAAPVATLEAVNRQLVATLTAVARRPSGMTADEVLYLWASCESKRRANEVGPLTVGETTRLLNDTFKDALKWSIRSLGGGRWLIGVGILFDESTFSFRDPNGPIPCE